MEKKKYFKYPDAVIISFDDYDIITSSGDYGKWWGEAEGDEFYDE